MLTILPRRLREVRTARRMTFEQLHDTSGVSTRQIMRVEGAEGPFRCRPNTLKRLAVRWAWTSGFWRAKPRCRRISPRM